VVTLTRKPSPPGYPITELKGAPRGMLLYYVLHSISLKPRHGYEILQDIDSKTDGAWRPGVGSVYPVLKKLLDKGFVKAEETGEEENRKVYRITEKGTDLMKRQAGAFSGGLQRWMAMRKLYFDMLDPAGLSQMFVEGSRKQFEMTKELLEARRSSLPENDVEFMLREYSLNLERQLDWTQSQLRDLRSRHAEPKMG